MKIIGPYLMIFLISVDILRTYTNNITWIILDLRLMRLVVFQLRSNV